VVQDRSQGEVVELADPRPGSWLLDVCAAPGGKSLAFADRGCVVLSSDRALPKLRVMRTNMPVGWRLLAQDGRRPALTAAFDQVLLDAPCSNSGVLGRRPEARLRFDQRNLANLLTLQKSLIQAAAQLVAPGGRLLYSTCSVTPGENTGVAGSLAGWHVVAERSTWPDEWQAGGYIAVLERD
jgi:16S rRNA (cytosine967-C5)-methyltransferase